MNHKFSEISCYVSLFLLLIGAYLYPSEKQTYRSTYGSTVAQPNEKLTPGATENLSAEYLCSHSTKERRKTTDREKELVFKNYGIIKHGKEWEVDHRISLCASGLDSIDNLWPQPSPDFHWKDRIEADVCRQICKGTMTVKEAQQTLLNWYPYYLKEKDKLGSFETPIDPDSE